MSQLLRFFRQYFRSWYEKSLNLDYGINMFLVNFAFIQVTPEEEIELNSPSPFTGQIVVSSSDMRPVLTYKLWPMGAEFKDFERVQLIIEKAEKGFRFQTRKEVKVDGESQWSGWEITSQSEHEVAVLKDLFYGFAFHQPMQAAHKRKIK